LYKALSGDANPSFSTVMKVIAALKLKLTITPAETLIQAH
jgi:DNA-binding phage protein